MEKIFKDGEVLWYKEICERLGEKEISSRTKQYARWDKFLKREPIGKKFSVMQFSDVVEKPVERQLKSEDTYKISKYTKESIDDLKGCGIYSISDDEKNIYIGSTTNCFLERYSCHKTSNTTKSREIMCKNHNFSILLKHGDGEVDEELLRRIENAYIQYYEYHTDYNVVNSNGAYSFTKPKKEKYKKIMVKEKEYEEIMKLLKSEGYIA